MDYQPISELLEKYFRGETSLEEEAALQAHFRRPQIEPALEQYRPLFAYLDGARSEKLAPDFSTRILTEIAPSGQTKLRQLRPILAKAAAVLLLVLAAFWYFQPGPPPPQTAEIDWSKYEPKTAEEAYEITRGALLLTSRHLNKSAKRVADEVTKVQEASQIFK